MQKLFMFSWYSPSEWPQVLGKKPQSLSLLGEEAGICLRLGRMPPGTKLINVSPTQPECQIKICGAKVIKFVSQTIRIMESSLLTRCSNIVIVFTRKGV